MIPQWTVRRAPALLGAAVLTLAASGHAAVPTGPKVASDEVYLDVSTGDFGGRLSHGNHETAIAIIEPVGTNATLLHWSGTDTACAEVPQKATRRAGTPTGSAVNGMQKLVFKVGPLWAGRTHCLKVVIRRLAPLSSREQGEVEAALKAALRDLGDGVYRGQRSNCPATGSTLRVCQLVHLFRSTLGWKDARTLADRPGAGGTGNIYTELADSLAGDADLVKLMERTLLMYRNRVAVSEAVAQKTGWLLQEAKQIPAGGVIHGPSQGTTPGTAAPRPVVLTAAMLSKAVEDIRARARDKKMAALRTLTNAIPTVAGVKKLPGWKTGPASTVEGQPLIMRLAVLVHGLQTALTNDAGARKALATITGDGAYKAFVARVKAVHRLDGAPVIVTPTPTFKERFPLYVTADLGVAVLMLAPGVYDAVQYLGVNIYFTAVDKEEPLELYQWAGRDFLRRFSLTLGVHILSPGLHGDEITGLVGSRMLMAGAGLRMMEHLRLSGGAVFYGQQNENPLVDEIAFRAGGFVGLSLDLDVIGTVAGWFKKTK